jgi:hypothetical protein
MTGRVYYDLNKNEKYDGKTVDAPIANTEIFLLLPGSRKRLIRRQDPAPIGNTTTNAEGEFVIAFPPQTPGTNIVVVKDLVTRDPLLQSQATASGGAPETDIPIPRPSRVGFISDCDRKSRGADFVVSFNQPEISSTAIAANIASVKGKGLAGYTAILLCDGVECGSALIGADGSFTVASTFRKSGTTILSVTQMDSAGRESDATAASQIVILQPPTITSIGPEGRTGVIVGKGTPGAAIIVYFKADNKSAGTTTVGTDGSWTVRVSDLPVGTTPLTATQSDSAGVSDLMEAGSVSIAAPATSSIIPGAVTPPQATAATTQAALVTTAAAFTTPVAAVTTSAAVT